MPARKYTKLPAPLIHVRPKGGVHNRYIPLIAVQSNCCAKVCVLSVGDNSYFVMNLPVHVNYLDKTTFSHHFLQC